MHHGSIALNIHDDISTFFIMSQNNDTKVTQICKEVFFFLYALQTTRCNYRGEMQWTTYTLSSYLWNRCETDFGNDSMKDNCRTLRSFFTPELKNLTYGHWATAVTHLFSGHASHASNTNRWWTSLMKKKNTDTNAGWLNWPCEGKKWEKDWKMKDMDLQPLPSRL